MSHLSGVLPFIRWTEQRLLGQIRVQNLNIPVGGEVVEMMTSRQHRLGQVLKRIRLGKEILYQTSDKTRRIR